MRMMHLYILACLAAALLPTLPWLAAPNAERITSSPDAPGWPQTFEGRPLSAMPLAKRDARFARGFPGRVGTFTDGRRTLILRWIARPTRLLHPAAHCFAGAGYTLTPQPLHRDANGGLWGCFLAHKDTGALKVCEQIRDAQGNAWSDVSSWYWATLLGLTQGPWWSTTTVEPLPSPQP